MGGFYMAYLESLCRRRGWDDPLYETYRSSAGFTCLVLVNGREYQSDLAYESDGLAQENAAMRAFMSCRNFSINGGMLARSGIVQGLPANEGSRRHRRRGGGRSHSVTLSSSSGPSSSWSSSESTTSGESESSIESIYSDSSISTASTIPGILPSIADLRMEDSASSTELKAPFPALLDANPLAISNSKDGELEELTDPPIVSQKLIQSHKLVDIKEEIEGVHLFPNNDCQTLSKGHEDSGTEQSSVSVSNVETFTILTDNTSAIQSITSKVDDFSEDAWKKDDNCGLSVSSHSSKDHVDQFPGRPGSGEFCDELHHEIRTCDDAEDNGGTGKPLINQSGHGSANGRSHCGLEAIDACECYPDRSSNSSDTNISESDDSTSNGSMYQQVCSVIGNGDQDQKDFALPILDPMRRELVDKVMEEFWIIFGQIMCADPDSSERNGSLVDGDQVSNNGNDATSCSSTYSSSQLPSIIKHKRRVRDEGDGGDADDQRKKAPSKRFPLPSAGASGTRFACPFRKHNPRIYTIYSHRSCALSFWTTIARIKEHLYRCHRKTPHCQRCWLIFDNQEQLGFHMTVSAAEICEVKIGQPPDGISAEDEQRLRSRKRRHPNQSDEETWRDVYRILFPNEDVPSPYFEPIQDDVSSPPEARELADYEDYMRRELPSFVRRNIEETVRRETQPLEASLIASLIDIVREGQESISRAYRRRSESVNGTQTSSHMPPDISETPSRPDGSQRVSAVMDQHGTSFLDGIAEAPPLQQWDGLTMSELNFQLPDHLADELSHDSGYGGSLKNCNCWGTCSCQTIQSAGQGISMMETTPVPVNPEQEDEFLKWTHFSNLGLPDSTDPGHGYRGGNE